MDLHLASIWEDIADSVPDEIALVHGPRSRTWREFDDRSARLAAALRALGVGEETNVALDLFNCSEYLEAFFATVKLNAVHVNVNYRYREDELLQLLDDADAEVVIAHASLAERVREIAPRLHRLREVIEVSEGGSPSTGLGYEALIAGHAPLARTARVGGMFLSYTGGTTGLPKGVMYEMAGVTDRTLGTRALICGVDARWEAGPAAVARELRDRGERPIVVPASPLMHSTAFTFASLPALTAGGCVTTLESRRFDPDLLLDSVEAVGATVVAIVGDAFGRPMVQSLDARRAARSPYDGSSVKVICSAGVAWSAGTKARLLDHLPRATLVDACGSTEGGTYGVSIVRGGDDPATARFERAPGTIVLDDRGEEAPPGVTGPIAAVTQTTGYYKHPERTAETFRIIGGVRYVVPGDLGRVEPDGSITLLGRGSSVINTGGEKVHPEEVEDALKTMPAVVDVIVVGVPDERLGQAVGAVVEPVAGAPVSHTEIVAFVRDRLAGYKAPRRVVFVDRIPRAPNGKADLALARSMLSP